MNMLSSLKAMLFSSTVPVMPGEAGVAGAAVAPGVADFAQLLTASMGDGEGAEAAALPVAGKFLPPESDQAVAEPQGEPKGRALGRSAEMPMPPGLALGLARHRAADQPSADQSAGDQPAADQPPAVEAEGGDIVADMPLPSVQADIPETEISVKTGPKRDKPAVAAPVTRADPVAVEASVAAEPALDVGDDGDRPESEPAAEIVSSVPVPAPVPSAIPVVAEVSAAAPAVEAKPAKVEEADKGRAKPVRQEKIAATDAAKVTEQVSVEAVEPNAPPAQRVAPEAPRVAAALAGAGKAVSQDIAPAVSEGAEAPERAPVLNGKPAKAEAAALLQIVRDQVAARQSGADVRVGEAVSAAAHARKEPPAAAPDPIAGAAAVVPDASPQPVASAPVNAAAPMAPPVVVPTVDLSASLGAQIVDMGVSGQWIDGLARDVAGLSANGAQGRFQIHTDQLGPVQVDIRHGGEGAAVSLTVANEAAELALRQDSERLKIDAGLAFVRIAEVKVERAPLAEAARADSAGQQSQQQSQSHHSSAQNQPAWANGNQNMGQPQGQQGRWQARENNGFAPKSSADPAVLNHAEARQDAGENRRTRYA